MQKVFLEVVLGVLGIAALIIIVRSVGTPRFMPVAEHSPLTPHMQARPVGEYFGVISEFLSGNK